MITTFKEFISEQEALNEMFGGRDKGYPYKDLGPDEEYKEDHKYAFDIPDNAGKGKVEITAHEDGTHHVNFTVPSKGYGLSPEAKKTYDKEYDKQISLGNKAFEEHFGAHLSAVKQVYAKHGKDEGQRARDSFSSSVKRGEDPFAAKHNYAIMSTVGKILRDHAKNHPEVSHYRFSSSGDVDSRDDLYDFITKKEGGTTETMPSYGKTIYKQYTIPVKR
jgi:hypothetical protein